MEDERNSQHPALSNSLNLIQNNLNNRPPSGREGGGSFMLSLILLFKVKSIEQLLNKC